MIRNLEEGNPFKQLWSIFDINLTFIGNNLIYVGNTIYLDPTISGLGSPYKEGTVSNLMGLGGYYLVTSVRHSYYPIWETQVDGVIITPSSQQATYSTKSEFISY